MLVPILLLCILAFAIAFFMLNFNKSQKIFNSVLSAIWNFCIAAWKKIAVIAKFIWKWIVAACLFIRGLFAKLGSNIAKRREIKREVKEKMKASGDNQPNTPTAQKTDKKGKESINLEQDKNKRLNKQFTNARPILLPPENEEIIEDDIVKGDPQKNDPKVIKKPVETSQKEVKESSEVQENAGKKKASLPSMQYRFSANSFNKNKEEQDKKKSLQAELDEILKQASSEPELPKKPIPSFVPGQQFRFQNTISPAEDSLPNTFTRPRFQEQTQSPFNSDFVPNSMLSNSMNTPSQFGQFRPNSPISTTALNSINQADLTRPNSFNSNTNSASIPVSDFDLNKLPDDVKKKIIVEYFGKK